MKLIPSFFLLAAAALLPGAWGQSLPATDSVVRLPEYVAETSREDRPAGGFAFVTEAGSTRAVSRVNEDILAAFAVNRVEDLSPLVRGAVSAPPYGLTGVPLIRGDLGDAAWNGQRRAYNRNVFPVSFNAVEAVEVLAGAPPAAFGLTNGTGGLLNFVTKAPAFQPRAEFTLTSGSWQDFRAQFDATGPLSSQLAYRVSLERRDANSFYRLLGERSWSGYLAFTWRPQTDVSWDFNAETYQVAYAENPGINRPTQALIDRGEYVTGSSVQNGGTGSYFGNTFTPTGIVRVDGSQILLGPDDQGWARAQVAQLTGTFGSSAGRQIVNRTYFERVTSEKYAAYTFYSYLPRSLTLENRTEVREKHNWAGVGHDLLWGVAFRAEERISYVDFFNEAMNAFDLTLDPATYRFPTAQLFGVRPVPGRPGRHAVSGARYAAFPTTSLSQTLHSKVANAGVFLQDALTLPGSFTLILGARADLVHADSEDPLLAPGFLPVSGSIRKILPAGTVSLAWGTNGLFSPYMTLNRAAAAEPSSGSGGHGLTNNHLPGELFENASDLIEIGARFRTVDHRLSGQLALYQQDRVRTNPRFGLPDELRVRGVEAAGEWKLFPAITLTGNASYLAASYRDGPLPGGIATVPQFDSARPSDNFPAYARGNYRVPGLPRWIANLTATYLAPSGWGLRFWGSLQGSQNLDLFGRVVIPAQETWNVGGFLRHRDWSLSCDLLNATDEFNWRPTSSPFAGADLVTRELPRHVRFTVRRRF